VGDATLPGDNRSHRGSALPIVAIVAGALVGVVSPVAVAAVARRSKRELDASAARQQAALDAERERLATTLAAESQRHRREVERTLLDQGSILISDFRDVVADVKLDPRGKPIVTDSWRQTVHAVLAFRGRLLLWFPENSPIVDAFDSVTLFTSWSTSWRGELRAGERKVKLACGPAVADPDESQDGVEYAIEDIDVAHLRYVLASRAHLTG
jgi:hypothetical protein